MCSPVIKSYSFKRRDFWVVGQSDSQRDGPVTDAPLTPWIAECRVTTPPGRGRLTLLNS